MGPEVHIGPRVHIGPNVYFGRNVIIHGAPEGQPGEVPRTPPEIAPPETIPPQTSPPAGRPMTRIPGTRHGAPQAIADFNQGTRLLMNKQYEEAIQAFAQAIALNPNLAEAHWNTAFAYRRLHQYDKSLSALEVLIQLQPNDAESIFAAGNACHHLHKYQEAYDYYKNYLRIASNGENATVARVAIEIIEHNFLHNAEGDYLADATKDCLVRWTDNSIPVTVYIDEDPKVRGYTPEFKTALIDAFSEWTEASGGKIRFEFTDKRSGAKVVCSWTDDTATLGGPNELGLTKKSFKRDGQIVSATIGLYTLADHPELSADEIVAMQKEVDRHEIGHALGLGHSKTVYDIMYFQVCPQGLEYPLTGRDKRTILALYGTQWRSRVSQRIRFSQPAPAS
jgi:predicted Zn-dependent protease